MKNTDRRSGSRSDKNNQNKQGKKPMSASDLREETIRNESVQAQRSKAKAQASAARAKAKSKQHSKDAEPVGSAPAEKEVLYQVKTKRTSDILLAYITFTYRVLHPAVTTRLIFYGILVAVPGFIIKIQALKIALWAIGGLLICLGLFRQYISLSLTKNSDPDYKSGIEFTYDFTEADASSYRGEDLAAYIPKYKEITSFYHDEGYYYLGVRNGDFFILPKNKFTIGDQADFEDFIYKKSKMTCRWIPNTFKNKMAKRRAVRTARSQSK